MALYSEKVMDHFRNPRNVGVIENADGVGEVGNAKCGDIMRIYLKIDDDIITDVKFETFGCGSAIASSSMATEMIKGKPVSDALRLTNKAVAEALDGLPAHRRPTDRQGSRPVSARIAFQSSSSSQARRETRHRPLRERSARPTRENADRECGSYRGSQRRSAR